MTRNDLANYLATLKGPVTKIIVGTNAYTLMEPVITEPVTSEGFTFGGIRFEIDYENPERLSPCY